jgi:hypothetical protein
MIRTVVLSAVLGVVVFSMSMLQDDIDDKLMLMVAGAWLLIFAFLFFRYSSLRLPHFASLTEGEKDQFKLNVKTLLAVREAAAK